MTRLYRGGPPNHAVLHPIKQQQNVWDKGTNEGADVNTLSPHIVTLDGIDNRVVAGEVGKDNNFFPPPSEQGREGGGPV